MGSIRLQNMDPSLSARAIPPEDIPPEIEAGLSPQARATARRCLTALAVLSGGSMLGVSWSLYLVNHYPLLLIALSPIGRHLILVAPFVHPLAFIAVAVGRRMLFYLPCFHLGRALGAVGILWLESRAPRTGRFLRWLETLFQRAPRLVVFLLPGPGMSTIAGASGMATRTYVPLIAAGLILRMILVIFFAEWLREPIEVVRAWVDEYWVPGTVVMITGVALYQWRKRRRSGSTLTEESRL